MENPQKKYKAFISYSQKDKRWAAKIHSWLESYRVPAGALIQIQSNRRLGKFFRDDDEMSASSDLASALKEALINSENLIVICSPNSAKSEWVDAEIRHFRETGRADNIFAIIVSGEPNSTDPNSECFPPSLRAYEEEEGIMPIEPLAIDLLKDGKSRACTRLAAGLLKIDFDDLWRREQRRKTKQLIGWALLVFSVLMIYAVILAYQTRLFNGDKAQFFGQMAELQNAAVDSGNDEDKGQYDRALRFGVVATREGILDPVTNKSQDELVKTLHSMPDAMQLNSPDRLIGNVALSHGRTKLAMVELDVQGDILIVDLNDFKIIERITHGLSAKIRGVTWHPTRNWLGLFDDEGVTYILDLDARKVIFKTPSIGQTILTTSFSDNGQYLLIRGWSSYQVWELATGKLVDRLSNPKFSSMDVAWVPWSTNIAVLPILKEYGSKQSLRIRDVVEKKDLLTLGGDASSISTFSLPPSGKGLMIHERLGNEYSEYAYKIAYVDLPSGERKLETSVDDIYNFLGLEANDRGGLAGIVSKDKELHFYEFTSGNKVKHWQVDFADGNVPALLSHTGSNESVLIGSENGVIRLYSKMSNDKPLLKIQAHNGQGLNKLILTNAQDKLISHGSDGNVMVWDIKGYDNLVHKAPLNGMVNGFIKSLQFNHNRSAVLALNEGSIGVMGLPVKTSVPERLIQPFESKSLFTLPTHMRSQFKILDGYFTDDKNNVRFIVNNGEIIEVPIIGDKKLSTIEHIPEVIDIAKANTDKVVMAVATKGGVYTIDGENIALLTSSDPETIPYTKVAVSPDGKFIAAGTEDGQVRLWSLANRNLLNTFKLDSASNVKLLSFTPSSQYLFVGGPRKGAKLFHLPDGDPVNIDAVNERFWTIDYITYSPNGKLALIQGSNNNTLVLHAEYGIFDLNENQLQPDGWRFGSSEKTAFLNDDRVMYMIPQGEQKLVICSISSLVCLARKHNLRYFTSGALFDDDQDIMIVDNFGGLLFWSVGWLVDDNVRQNLCSGIIDPNLLIVTDEDVRQAPMLVNHLGQNVCDINAPWYERFFSSSKPKPFVSIAAHTPDDYLNSIENFATADNPTSKILRQYLSEFEFKALDKINGSAEIRAQLLQATGYIEGIGVPKDFDKAEEILKALVKQENSIAQFNLAMALTLKQDKRSAINPEEQEIQKLIAASAQQGFWAANQFLGVNAYQNENFDQARKYFKQAVENGDKNSMHWQALVAEAINDKPELPSINACELHRQAAIAGAGKSLMPFLKCIESGVLTTKLTHQQLMAMLKFYGFQDNEPKVRQQAQSLFYRYIDPLVMTPKLLNDVVVSKD
ncbi:TIR domain-containing protein [Glaciecola sp. 1036]|uniref:TIR domain-containing protein n=1 Tax=Alteromonadaceae TaxID=72275 RepID=UPI003CFEE2DF